MTNELMNEENITVTSPEWKTMENQPGFIDIHSHLLPGIDDGCRTVDESIKCIRGLQAHGFRGSICTPHYSVNDFPHNIPVNISKKVANLRQALEERDISYLLWEGAEVRLAPDTIFWFENFGVPTLGQSRWVLVDFWDHAWPAYAEMTLDYLLDRDYKPILAHPERMNLPQEELEDLLYDLAHRQIPLQGNLNSLQGGEGTTSSQRMRTWLREGRYFLVATDLHSPTQLEGRMRGKTILETDYGPENLQKLLQSNPEAILFSSAPT